jgi:predicted Zn-dependent protease
VTLRFQGRGKRLVVTSVQSSDPSADALRSAEEKLAAGNVLEAIAAFDSMLYWQHYIDGREWSARILDAAYLQAQTRYRANDAAGAAELMKAAFGFAENFEQGREPSDPKRRILLRNEYGFYLAEAGRNEEAGPVLAGVVAQAPERAVARLNLGDVQWAQGKKDAACVQYAAYAALRPGAAWPPRLAERCPALVPLTGSTGPR